MKNNEFAKRISTEPTIISGWLIQQRSPDGTKTDKFLQIGTGQWCPSQSATRFPARNTAMIYAHEFGYSVGYTADVVPYVGGNSFGEFN